MDPTLDALMKDVSSLRDRIHSAESARNHLLARRETIRTQRDRQMTFLHDKNQVFPPPNRQTKEKSKIDVGSLDGLDWQNVSGLSLSLGHMRNDWKSSSGK
jgi:hypothetical protein